MVDWNKLTKETKTTKKTNHNEVKWCKKDFALCMTNGSVAVIFNYLRKCKNKICFSVANLKRDPKEVTVKDVMVRTKLNRNRMSIRWSLQFCGKILQY